MSDTDATTLRKQALRRGFLLRPIPEKTLETLKDLHHFSTAAEVAERRGIARTAASNRLARVQALGLASSKERDRVLSYRLTKDGHAAILTDRDKIGPRLALGPAGVLIAAPIQTDRDKILAVLRRTGKAALNSSQVATRIRPRLAAEQATRLLFELHRSGEVGYRESGRGFRWWAVDDVGESTSPTTRKEKNDDTITS